MVDLGAWENVKDAFGSVGHRSPEGEGGGGFG